MGSMLGAFYWLFLWNFKEKSINVSYGTAKEKTRPSLHRAHP